MTPPVYLSSGHRALVYLSSGHREEHRPPSAVAGPAEVVQRQRGLDDVLRLDEDELVLHDLGQDAQVLPLAAR